MDTEIINKITNSILKELAVDFHNVVPIGVSNRHIHITDKDLKILFGTDYKLKKLKSLRQPGEYASEEKVDLIGPKGEIKGVRILGPTRKETQVEILASDAYKLGIKAPIRNSGDLEDTPGIIVRGPKGFLKLDKGVIIASRHIHMPELYAQKHGYKDGDKVCIEGSGVRKVTFHNVLIRVKKNSRLELHIDIDESNASGLKNGETVKICRK